MASELRTDHVGSLIRPAALLDARDAYKAGHIGRDALRAAEDRAILDALELQRQVGIAVFTDGEMRRDAYTTDLYDAVEGFEDSYPVREETRPDGTKELVEYHTKAICGRLKPRRRMTAHESAFLKQHAPGPFKITMATPVRHFGIGQGPPPDGYPSWDEVQTDLVDIFRREVQALADEGVPYIQFDKVITAYASADGLERLRQQGIDPEQALAAEIAAENACYDAAAGRGITLAMHLCRGNRTAWSGGSGGYDWPAERLFRDLRADRFLLEYDTERAGGFEPLRFVPKGKTVMLGLVTTKSGRLERQDDLLRRIEEAATYCPIEQLALGPQCGFQSAADRNGAHMTFEEQRRKLELIVDTARKVWG
jgi:5-methyltetrahydropteroyltriglutamate--homocysteine methyltransferase